MTLETIIEICENLQLLSPDSLSNSIEVEVKMPKQMFKQLNQCIIKEINVTNYENNLPCNYMSFSDISLPTGIKVNIQVHDLLSVSFRVIEKSANIVPLYPKIDPGLLYPRA